MGRQGKYDFIVDAEIKHLKAAAESSRSAAAFAALAKAFNVRGMFPQALEAADRATELDAEQFTGWFEYAIAASAVGGKHLSRILERTQGLLVRGVGNEGEIKTALALTNYYLALDDAARVLAEEALASNRAECQANKVLGYIAYNANDFRRSLDYFQTALRVDTENARAHWMVGHCNFELDDLEAARESYHRAVELQPHFANAWFSLGKVYLVSDQLQQACQCFGKAISINPRLWDCFFTQADYHLGHKSYISAIAACQRIVELEPDAPVLGEALNYIGEVYLVMGDHDTAQHYFEEAIGCGGDTAVSHNYLGVTLMKKDRIEEAVEHFKTAIEKAPDFAYPITKLGQAYLNQRKYTKAKQMFKRALEVDANEYWAWLGLSDVYRRQRRYRKQLEACKRALEIEKDDSDIHNYLGIAYELLKDPEKAEASYLRSLQLDPLNRKAANNIGFLYEKLYKQTGEEEYSEKSKAAWKQRLLICRDTKSSIEGAKRHLRKLGVSLATINNWLETARLEDNSIAERRAPN